MTSSFGSPPKRSLQSIAADIVDSKEKADSLIDAYAQNVQAARERASMRSAARYLVVAGYSDRPGVVAAVCRHLANLGFNIEQARVMVAAGCVLFHTLATAPVASGSDPVRTGADLKKALDETPLGDRSTFAHVDPLPPGAPPLLFDQARSYRIKAEIRKQQGVLSDITGAVADHGGAILSLSSWLEKAGGLILDMRLAVSPGRVGSLRERLAEVEQRLGEPILLTSGDEVETRPARTSASPDTVVALTVMGHARPGFVFRVLKEVGNESGEDVGDRSVVVSSMVVLDAYNLLILMIDAPPLEGFADRLKERLQKRLSAWGRECDEPLPFVVHAATLAPRPGEGPWYGLPTHRVTYSGAPDERGVLADVAEIFAHRQINIVWLDASVKADVDGNFAPFEVQTEITIPGDQEEDVVRAEVKSLAGRHKWEWSFGRVVDEATAEP